MVGGGLNVNQKSKEIRLYLCLEKSYEVTCLSSQANSRGVYLLWLDLQIPLLLGNCGLSQGAGSLKTPGEASTELCKD